MPRRPADTGEARALLAEISSDAAPPVFTGSVPEELPASVRGEVAGEERVLVSAGRLDGIREYRPRDLTVTVGAGTRMTDLRDRLREEGQWLPISRSGLSRSAGGLVAAVPPSPYAGEYGPVRRQVLAVRVVTHAGESLDWGRAVMKNVAGYDMPRLVCGSRGRLGLVTRVTFRVWPLPEERRRIELHGGPREDTPGPLDATADVDAGQDWRPEAETWSWSAGGRETPPLVVELAGSAASVEARSERLERWADSRGLVLERGSDEDRFPGRPELRVPCLRFRVGRGYVGDVAAALRETAAARWITAHPRRGVVTAHVDDGDAAVSAATAAAPDASVGVARGGPGLHERAEALRAPDRVELERRVVSALDGRERSWIGDFV